MGKIVVIENVLTSDLPNISTIKHDNVIMENKAGEGGGLHLMLDI